MFKELLKAKTIKRAKIIWRNRKESNRQFANFKPLFEENLEKLVSIYQPESKDDYEYMAEMYRQLGNHAKAREMTVLMKGAKAEDSNQRVIG